MFTATTTINQCEPDIQYVNIRPIRPTEIENVVNELWQPFAADMESRNERFELADNATKAMINNFRNGIRQDGVFILVAEVDNEVIGYLLFEIRDTPPIFKRERDCALDQLYVKPEHRGKSIGQALIDRAILIGKEKGAETVVLTIDAENEGALKFFDNLGYDIWRHHLYKPIEDL
ncbi:GNAT family N-acetyltransferase [Natrialbaceae archaeon A-chndr2]